MKPGDLVEALKTVPEFRPLLVDLTWKLLGEDGEIDDDKVAFHAQELAAAISDAGAYGQATREMVRCLRMIPR